MATMLIGLSDSPDQPTVNERGQQCIRFFRNTCTRGQQGDYGRILGSDSKPLPIAPELLARYDKHAAAKEEAKKKNQFFTQTLMLNAIEKADWKCYCLLDSGANTLALPKEDSIQASEAQCTVPGVRQEREQRKREEKERKKKREGERKNEREEKRENQQDRTDRPGHKQKNNMKARRRMRKPPNTHATQTQHKRKTGDERIVCSSDVNTENQDPQV